MTDLDKTVARLQDHDRSIRTILADALLENVPAIPGVEPLPGGNGKAFTVRSGALSGGTILSPEYYDAAFQAKAVSERVRNAPSAERAVAILKEAAGAADRAFPVNTGGRTSIVLHPAVAGHCRKLLENPPEIRCLDFEAESPEPGR